MGNLEISGIADEAGYAIEDQIRAHKELGWEYIDIRVVDGENLTAVSNEKFEEIYKKVSDSGLKVSAFASGICCWGRSVRHDFQLDIDDMKRAIPRMQRFGTKYIRIMSCPHDADAGIPEDEHKRETFRRIKELAKMADDGGVVMVHEHGGTMWTHDDPDRMIELYDTVDSPGFALLFDMANFGEPNQGEKSWEAYQKIKDKVQYVHLKDRVDADTCTWIGEGIIPVRKLLKAMVDDGYDWFVSMEAHIAAVHHIGTRSSPEVLYDTYIKNGKKATQLVKEANEAG
jgi:sugar phosphate isomerase/epimerase